VRAAARLGYTQSAVSQQVAALERALGKRLLERTQGRGPIELTPAGRILMRCAESVARELALTRATLERVDATDRVLHVGVHASTGLSLLPEVLAVLDVRVRLVESPDERHLLELVAHDQLDVAFVSMPVTPEFASTELLVEEYVAVAADGAGVLTPTMVVPRPVHVLRNARMLAQLERYFESFGVSLEVGIEADYPETLCELAARGHGIAILPRSLARGAVVRDLESSPLRRLGLAWRSDAGRAADPLARFVAAARRALAMPRVA
jgi:DNA-binding transcriptional LysR family regulator